MLQQSRPELLLKCFKRAHFGPHLLFDCIARSTRAAVSLHRSSYPLLHLLKSGVDNLLAHLRQNINSIHTAAVGIGNFRAFKHKNIVLVLIRPAALSIMPK